MSFQQKCQFIKKLNKRTYNKNFFHFTFFEIMLFNWCLCFFSSSQQSGGANQQEKQSVSKNIRSQTHIHSLFIHDMMTSSLVYSMTLSFLYFRNINILPSIFICYHQWWNVQKVKPAARMVSIDVVLYAQKWKQTYTKTKMRSSDRCLKTETLHEHFCFYHFLLKTN